MAANVEYQLISKIVETQDLRSAQKLKITDEFFYAPECREIFRHLWSHHHNSTTYGSIPSRELIQARFPAFTFAPSSDSIPTLCDALRDARLSIQLNELADTIERAGGQNPAGVLSTLRASITSMSSQHEIDDDMMLSDAYEELEKEYQLTASGNGLVGIPYPWPILNEETQGMQGGEFNVLYGRPKSLKSWLAIYIASHAYFHSKRRVLFYSLELKPLFVLRRTAACLAQVSYGKVKKGKLNEEEYERFFGMLKTLKDDEAPGEGKHRGQAFLAVGRNSKNRGGISSLQAKIQEFEPDLVVVDGMYLMRDDRQNVRSMDWKSIAHVSQDLKSTASTFNIPVIGVTQQNRQTAKSGIKDMDTTELAYADAIGQDCDMLIRVQKQIDPLTKESELVLGFPATRESALDAFVIHGIPATCFSYKRAIMSEGEQTVPAASAPLPVKSAAPTGVRKRRKGLKSSYVDTLPVGEWFGKATAA